MTFRRHLKAFGFSSVTGNLSPSLCLLSLFQRKPTKMQLLYKSVLRVERAVLDRTPLMTAIKCKYARHSLSWPQMHFFVSLCVCVWGEFSFSWWVPDLQFNDLPSPKGLWRIQCRVEITPWEPWGLNIPIVPLFPVLLLPWNTIRIFCMMSSTQP